METDLEGNVKWEQTYFESSLGYSVIFAQNYGYLLLGTLKNDIYLIRTNNDGIAEWNTTLGSSFVSATMCTLSDGGYIISGTKKILDGTTSEPEKHIWVIKLASEQPEQNTNIETILIETLLAINVEVILIVAILLLIVVIVSLFLLEKTVKKAMNTRFSSLMLFPPFSIIALVHKTH
jgi:hypothetical protein